MTTPTWITGFEHGVATPVTNGGGLCDVVSGTPSVQATTKRTGGYALELNRSATTHYIQKTLTGAAYQVGSIYIYFKTALPSASCLLIYGINTDGNMVLWFNPSDNKLRMGKVGASGDVLGPVVTYNTWYRIDYRFYTNATTHTIDWQVDGAAQTQYSIGTRTAVNLTAVRLSCDAGTADVFYDDVIISATSADYPIGAHEVVGLKPNIDGTHVGGTNIIEDQAGTDIVTPGYTTAYSLMNSLPIGDATAYVKQSGTGASNYAEVGFETATQPTFLGVMGLLAYKSASTTANSASTRVRDGSTETVIYTGDMSESSNFYKSAIVTPATSWSQSAIDGLIGRVGYASDANPVPYWLDVILEVAYVPSSGTSTPMTFTGGNTPGGTLVKQGQKTLAGGATPSGTLVKNDSKAFAGGSTPAGALAKSLSRLLTGGLTPAGVLTYVKAYIKLFTGGITPTGVMSKVLNAARTLTGGITPSGTVSKQDAKAFAGGITPSGILTNFKAVVRTFVGGITPGGTLARQIAKALNGGMMPTGTVTKSDSKTFAGGNTPSGVLTNVKAVVKLFVGAITPTGTLAKQTGKVLSGALSSAGNITKSIGKVLQGILDMLGSVVVLLVEGGIKVSGKVVAGDSILMAAGGTDLAYFLVAGVDSRIMVAGGSDQDYHKATAGDAGIGSVSAGDSNHG